MKFLSIICFLFLSIYLFFLDLKEFENKVRHFCVGGWGVVSILQ